MQFDHIDHTTKEISVGKLLSFSKQRIEKELEKCQLLCRRCHNRKTTLEGSKFKNHYRPFKLTQEHVDLIQEQLDGGMPRTRNQADVGGGESGMRIKTVADLKQLIKDIPDDTKVYLYQYDTVYDVEILHRTQECREQNGKKWIAEGLIIEEDG